MNIFLIAGDKLELLFRSLLYNGLTLKQKFAFDWKGKKMPNRLLFIAWEKHRRTIELCNFFSIPLFLLKSNLPRLVKHPIFHAISTFAIIYYRPKVLFVQNPSIFLALLSCLMHRFIGYKLVIDSHNAGLELQNDEIEFFKKVFRYIQSEADITIITNYRLESIIKKNGGRPYVLPDKIPSVPAVNQTKLINKYNVAYICTFSKDEPFQQVIGSVKFLPRDLTIYITGDSSKIGSEEKIKHNNIVYTGFLNEQDYWNLLSSVDIIMVLTIRENCLLCGAYEAVALKKPLIVSDTKALRDYFYKGCVYTFNDEKSISDNILFAIKNKKALTEDISLLRDELNYSWKKKADKFKEKLFEGRRY